MKLLTGTGNITAISLNGNNHKLRMEVSLTKREREILELTAEGLTAQCIAEKIFVSIDTVETHKRNIQHKLKARNMIEAVVKAMRSGLIE